MNAIFIACFFPIFQSTLPAGEATTAILGKLRMAKISIHASRGGSDGSGVSYYDVLPPISIHASRGGSDPSK